MNNKEIEAEIQKIESTLDEPVPKWVRDGLNPSQLLALLWFAEKHKLKRISDIKNVSRNQMLKYRGVGQIGVERMADMGFVGNPSEAGKDKCGSWAREYRLNEKLRTKISGQKRLSEAMKRLADTMKKNEAQIAEIQNELIELELNPSKD